jgi:hypothetical protein
MGKGVYVCMRGDNVTDAVRLSVLGRQPRSHRGFDESHSSVGELRDHLRSSLRFGYQHYPCERGDYSLHGRDGIAGWQRAAGHRLPHAALDQCGSQDALHKSWIIFHVCGGDALSTGYGALQRERVEARTAYRTAVRPTGPAPRIPTEQWSACVSSSSSQTARCDVVDPFERCCMVMKSSLIAV